MENDEWPFRVSDCYSKLKSIIGERENALLVRVDKIIHSKKPVDIEDWNDDYLVRNMTRWVTETWRDCSGITIAEIPHGIHLIVIEAGLIRVVLSL